MEWKNQKQKHDVWKCECKIFLLQKHDKNRTRSWQKYIPKIGVE